MPLLILGADVSTATEHVWDAQIGVGSNLIPAGFIFRYKNRPKQGEGWQRKELECSPSRRLLARKKYGLGSADCDEFPFYRTTRGGPNNHPGTVSLRPISPSHNRRAGALFGGLVTSSGLRKQRSKDFLVIASDEFPVSVGLPLNKFAR